MSEEYEPQITDSYRMMGTEAYAEQNHELYDKYIMLRVYGQHASVAFRRVFGEEMFDTYTQARIYAVENTEYYANGFRTLLNNTDISKLWNDKIAVNELLQMSRNVFAKDATRLAAMKELNVIVGVTVVDEKGNTRKGSSMADYYNALPKNDNAADDTTQPAADTQKQA